MKKILLTLAMIFSLGAFANQTPTEVNLKEGNFFAITSSFDQRLLDNFTEKVLNYSGDELYIYFNTPGGSVIALSRMARLMKSSNIKFTCVANFAASAGFMLFQHCDKRILLSDGVLMSHNWSGGFQGEGPRILTMFNTIQSLIDTLEAVAIEKMNVDRDQYLALINNNLWMTEKLATKYAAIDEVSDRISCSKKLVRKKVLIGYTRAGFFGPGKAVYKSGCPLIQKVYAKVVNENGVQYIGMKNTNTFKEAQTNYVLEDANWIYLGKK